jgi:hypothetical protein
MAKKQSARILLQNGGGHDRVSWASISPSDSRGSPSAAPRPQP